MQWVVVGGKRRSCAARYAKALQPHSNEMTCWFCVFVQVLCSICKQRSAHGEHQRKERVATVEWPPATDATDPDPDPAAATATATKPVDPSVHFPASRLTGRTIPRPWERKASDGSDTERSSGSCDEQSDSGSENGSAADDETESKATPTPSATASNRIRCIVKGVDGNSDREVWIDVGPR